MNSLKFLPFVILFLSISYFSYQVNSQENLVVTEEDILTSISKSLEKAYDWLSTRYDEESIVDDPYYKCIGQPRMCGKYIRKIEIAMHFAYNLADEVPEIVKEPKLRKLMEASQKFIKQEFEKWSKAPLPRRTIIDLYAAFAYYNPGDKRTEYMLEEIVKSFDKSLHGWIKPLSDYTGACYEETDPVECGRHWFWMKVYQEVWPVITLAKYKKAPEIIQEVLDNHMKIVNDAFLGKPDFLTESMKERIIFCAFFELVKVKGFGSKLPETRYKKTFEKLKKICWDGALSKIIEKENGIDAASYIILTLKYFNEERYLNYLGKLVNFVIKSQDEKGFWQTPQYAKTKYPETYNTATTLGCIVALIKYKNFLQERLKKGLNFETQVPSSELQVPSSKSHEEDAKLLERQLNELSEKDKKTILKYTRLLINGEKPEKFNFSSNLRKIKNPVIITLFTESGEFLISKRVDDKNLSLQEKLIKAVREIQNNSGIEADKYKNSYIHIMLVSYTAKFPNMEIKSLFNCKIYEPRVTGLIYRLKDKEMELSPLECLALNFRLEDSSIYLARGLGIKPEDIDKYSDLEIEVYRVIHFGERFPDRKLISFHRGHRVFTVKDVSNKSILNSLKLAGRWFSNNVVDGEVVYEYEPTTERYYNNERTMIRSSAACWVLNKLAYFLNDEKLKKLGESCIRYNLEHYFNITRSLKEKKLFLSDERDWMGETVSNIYTVATFTVAAILERDEYNKYSKEINLLMNWAMTFQRSDGFFRIHDARYQAYIPGQFLLAVAFLYEKTKEEKYKEFFDKSFNAYSKYIDNVLHLGDKISLPFAPGWFGQAFARMYIITRDKKYRDIVYKINDIILKWYQVNRFYKSYFDYDGILAATRDFHGGVSFTAASLESLVYGGYVAKLDNDRVREKKYRDVIKHTVAYLIRLQYTPENTYYIRHRERVIGGFKFDLVTNGVWMDSIWHLTNAFINIIRFKLLN